MPTFSVQHVTAVTWLNETIRVWVLNCSPSNRTVSLCICHNNVARHVLGEDLFTLISGGVLEARRDLAFRHQKVPPRLVSPGNVVPIDPRLSSSRAEGQWIECIWRTIKCDRERQQLRITYLNRVIRDTPEG